MSLFKIFDVSGSALSAQSVRLNTVASNMANAETASSTAEGVYRSKQPVFAAIMAQHGGPGTQTTGVRVTSIAESNAPPRMEYMPGHPLANEEGYVFFPAINMVEEMANMMSASRNYQNNVEMMNTVQQLMMRTLQLGQR
jgi:flagellar basal-body rod protein FlgC